MIELIAYKQHLIDLAQKWRTGWITEAEYQELDNWLRSLEDIALGPPTEIASDSLEKQLHEQLYIKVMPLERDEDFNASQLFVNK